MLVTLLVEFKIKDIKTTELGPLLQVLPVRIITFVETLGSHLKTVCFSVFILRCALCYHLCSTFSLEKKLIFTLFDPRRLKIAVVDPRRLKKIMLMH